MPYKGETSIFRVIRLQKQQIRSLSAKARTDKSPKGVGLLQAGDIYGTGLDIDPDNKPERHANIVSWPNEKEDRMMLAQELANAAVLEEYS